MKSSRILIFNPATGRFEYEDGTVPGDDPNTATSMGVDPSAPIGAVTVFDPPKFVGKVYNLPTIFPVPGRKSTSMVSFQAYEGASMGVANTSNAQKAAALGELARVAYVRARDESRSKTKDFIYRVASMYNVPTYRNTMENDGSFVVERY